MTDQNNVRTLLDDLGFGKSEAILYEFGAAQKNALTVQEMQRRTSLKRPTIYYALDQLADKGLVSRVMSQQKTSFMFQPPSKLELLVKDEVRHARTKLHSVAQLIDLMPIADGKEHTNVSHFEGLQGVKTVIDMTLYCSSRKWQVIAPFKNFLRDYDEKYSRYYVHTKRSRGITTQTLWKKIIPTSRTLSATEIKEKNPRIMPQTMGGRFESIIIIFDNKVAIIGPYSEMSAIVIESEEIVTMFEGLFGLIWDISTPYKDALRQAKKIDK